MFADLSGLEIDLGGDGIRNPSDGDDSDTGPNRFLNYPNLRQPTQAVIAGRACAGCTVEFYRTAHTPGGSMDFATVPITTVTASGDGAFSLAAPPVVPGEWITATATDADGNTRPSSRPPRESAPE